MNLIATLVEKLATIHGGLSARLEALERRTDALEARPGLEYLGVWEAGRVYPAGSATTHQGGIWIARTQTDAQPGLPTDASRSWTLAVKRGRNGRDGRRGDTTSVTAPRQEVE